MDGMVNHSVFGQPSAPVVVFAATKLHKEDVLGDVSKGVQHFYDSGQMWALLIGVVLGYLVKSITSS